MSELVDQLIVQLRRDEGEVLHAYKDSLGYWTIGVGRLIDPARGGGISKVESAILLMNDIESKTRELQTKLPWSGALSPARQGVLLNMAFQLGVNGLLGFRNTLLMVEQGEYEKAAAAMLQSNWAQQTPERAHRLSEQMRTGAWA
jgi:lysozyme